MLSNPPSNCVALIYHYSLYKKWLAKKLKAKLYQIHYKLHPLKILSVNHAVSPSIKYMTTIYHIFFYKKWIYIFFSSKNFYENKLQNAPFKKNFPGKHAPNPLSKCLATLRVASSFAACNPPNPKKVGHPLANHTYSHGLLLRNLFEEIRL